MPTPQRFWKFLAFYKKEDVTRVDELLALLSKPTKDATEKALQESILRGYREIKAKPFQPHAVARTRHLAYQYCVVMKYLDNLIAWGDSLFRQDTIESINEATQRYVLAANLLGARPQRIPPRGETRPMTFAELKQGGLNEIGNLLVELEGTFPVNEGLPNGADADGPSPLFGIGRTLYFCIPRNEKMLGYWDLVGDRLLKIRNCMNIEGVVRQLALFDPPLAPGMLVKAAAAGINLGSVISGLNQPVGPLRTPLLTQKALELCAEVRGLGSALLSAIEKADSERLTQLRQKHEVEIQQLAQDVRFLQWKQAQEATEALLKGRAIALERYRYYQRVLGLQPDDKVVPDSLDPKRPELTESNFDVVYADLVKQFEISVELNDRPALTTLLLPNLQLSEDAPPGGFAKLLGGSGAGRLYLNSNEDAELNSHLPRARDTRLLASAANTIASSLTLIPSLHVHGHFWGVGGSSELTKGEKLAAIPKFLADIMQIVSAWEQDQAGMASRTASYERRADEWMLQNNLAARELMQIGRQIIGSLIAEQIAYREYRNIQTQIAHSQEVDRFLQDKFTNAELYGWMQGELSRLYYEYYRFAFDLARKAEQTMKQELMRPQVDATSYIKFNYWDGGRKGLLSGEALYLDLKRLELAYHENNKREYELTKHVSLRQLNPLALLTLKATGTCELHVPEWLFDLDGPGHFMRRIKNVSLSIPSVTGPYTSVNCTLTLLKSTVRKTPLLTDVPYERQEDDGRFVDYFGTVHSIVTSSGNNDSGLFETNLRDERFLPFEGAGGESTWRLELPATFRQFDYDTISDVILHLRYTARQGGAQLRQKAEARIQEVVGKASEAGLALMFSLKHDFPGEWHRFVRGQENLNVTLKAEYFPYLVQNSKIAIANVEVYRRKGDQLLRGTPAGVDAEAVTSDLQAKKEAQISLASDDGALVRENEAVVYLVVTYSIAAA